MPYGHRRGEDPRRYPVHAAVYDGELKKLATTLLAKHATGGLADALAELDADGGGGGEGRQTPLQRAVRCKKQPDVAYQVVRRLIAAGADVRAVGGHGRTALHIYAWRGAHDDVKVALLLVGAGCDVGAKDSSGLTAAEVADRCGHPRTAAALQQAEASGATAQFITAAASSSRQEARQLRGQGIRMLTDDAPQAPFVADLGPKEATLRRALGAEAPNHYRAALPQPLGPAQLMLCHTDGSDKHFRWFWVQIGADGLPKVLWGKNRDGSNHIRWKSLDFSAPRKERTVTGGRAWSGATGFTFSVANGDDINVRGDDRGATRDAWLPVLRQIETVYAHFGAGLPPASVRSLVSAGCQTVQDLCKVDRRKVDAEAAQTVAMNTAQIQRALLPLLRDSLGADSRRTISDAVGLIALVQAGCRTKADVVALKRQAIDALPGAAPQEVADYIFRPALESKYGYTGQPFGGTGGALNTIATKGNTQPWTNPCDAGLVTVRTSSEWGGFYESHVVDRPPVQNGYFSSQGQNAGEWMAVDLRTELVITHYALRSSYTVLRNWVLEGADTLNGPWVTLRTHSNDKAITTASYGMAAWSVNAGRAFQCFRVRKTDGGYLCCAGIEFYGGGSGDASVVSASTCLALLRAGCRTTSDVNRLRARQIGDLPSHAAHEMAEYWLREPLGTTKRVLGSETLLALLLAGCKTKDDVLALKPEAIAALRGSQPSEGVPPGAERAEPEPEPEAAQDLSGEVMLYLAGILRESLGEASKGVLGDDTLLALVSVGCRTRKNVLKLSKQATRALSADASRQVTKFRKMFTGGFGRLVYNAAWKTTGTVQSTGNRPLPTEFYHGTSLDAAIKIQQTGFRPSGSGMMGAGVYMANAIRKTEPYMQSKGYAHGGVLFKLKVDLGRCKRVTSSGSSWIGEGYDSVWWDRGSNMNENCVKDPTRIKIVDAYLGHAAKAQEAGYFVEGGKVVKKAPKTGWVAAGEAGLAPTEFYHGTGLEGALAIQNHGFRIDKAGDNDGAMMGGGAYITTSLYKAYMYADNQHHGGARRPHDGAVLKLKVDLGKCYKVKRKNDPGMKTWMNRGFDSAWSPAGVNGVKGEHCVRDKNRIKVVDVYLMDTVKAGDGGYRVVPAGIAEEPVWEWKANDGWKPYSDAECAEIERAYASASRGSQGQTGSHVLRGGKYKIDFGRMRQARVGDESKTRAVRRTA